MSDEAVTRLREMRGRNHEAARKLELKTLKKDMREILNLVARGIVATLDPSTCACVCATRFPVSLTQFV